MRLRLVPVLALVLASSAADAQGMFRIHRGGSADVYYDFLAAQWPAGANSYAYYAANPLTSGATSATFAFRMRAPGSWPASEMTILQRDSASSIQKHIMIDVGTGGTLVFYVPATLTGAWSTCTVSGLVADTTYAVAGVFDGGQATDALRWRVYVNGTLRTCAFSGSIPTALTIPTTAVWTIGATFNGTQGLRSVMLDDIMIWSGIPLAPAQITELYNGGGIYDPTRAGSYGPPIAWWSFEQGIIDERIGTLGASVGTTNMGAVTFVGTMASTGPRPSTPSNPGCGVAQTSNTQRQLTWSVNEGGVAVVRGAYLSIPRDYDSSRLYPVEDMYHGCSFTGATLRADVNGPDIEGQASGGVVALYPDGLPEPTCIPINATGWTLTNNSHDLAFFDSQLYALRAQVCFDETQLLVGGRSMGGGFAQVLAGSRPSVIAKIATVSTAIAPLATPSAKWMYIGHAADDPTVNISVARAARDAWIAANGCTANGTSPWNSVCTQYTCTGAPLLYCEWATGGHTPNAANAGLIWQHWAWPGPMDAPQRLGPLANDAGNFFALWGDSTTYGSLTTALTTTPPWGSAYRSRSTYPFWAIREGTSSSGGSGHDQESPATAAAAELRALRTPGLTTKQPVIGEHGCPGCAWQDFQKGSVTVNNYRDTWTTGFGDAPNARAAAVGASQPFRVAGAFVRTGHNDDDQGWCPQFQTLYSSLRTTTDADVKAWSFQTHDVPYFWGMFSSWQNGNVINGTSQCARAIEQLAATDPRHHVLCFPSYHLGSTTTRMYNADGVHFTQRGYDLAGEYWGLCAHAVLDAGQPWGFVPRSVTLTAPNVVDLDYTGKVPCARLNTGNTSTTACSASTCCSGAPLVLDTTNVNTPSTGDQADAPQYGFELTVPGARPAVIRNVAIVNSTHVQLTTDYPIAAGSTVNYAWTAGTGGSGSGNGFATTDYGSPRGQLRDSMAITGRVTGETLYSWAPTMQRSIPGGVTPTANLGAAFDDRRLDFVYVASSTNPAAGTGWAERRGGFTMPYVSGTHTLDALPASLPLDGIGPSTRRLFNPTDATPSLYQQPAVAHTFDVPLNEDLWFRWAGYCHRDGVNHYLFYLDGGANNLAYVQLATTNAVVAFHDGTSGGGGAGNFNRAGLWPATDQWCLMDVYFEARGGNNGAGRIAICLNGDCAFTASGAALGDLVNVRMTIGAFTSGGPGTMVFGSFGFGFSIGNSARQTWQEASNFTIHNADYNRFCPPASRPCQ